MPLHPFKRPLAERFWEQVDKTPECWLWVGARDGRGYGSIGLKRKLLKVHRVSWELHNGPIPDGLLVCHKCDVRHCVRPDHLFLGSQRENIQDAKAKGRLATGDRSGARLHPEKWARGESHWSRRMPEKLELMHAAQRAHPELRARGEQHGRSRVTADQVRAMREEYAAGTTSQRVLARKYGIAGTTLRDILSRRHWAHIP